MEIKGQAAIVTGGASGLGAATARALAAAGAKVALLDVNDAGAQRGRRQDRRHRGDCDVTDAGSASRPRVDAGRGRARAGRILVNCAGIGRAKRIVGRDGADAARRFRAGDRDQPDRHLQHDAAARPPACSQARAARRRRARRDRLDRVGRGLRGPDRAGGLCVVEGRRRRADPAGGARIRAVRHPRADHRARHLPHADAARAAARRRRSRSAPRCRSRKRLGEPEEFAALACFIVRQRLSQRRSDPPRRRAAHGAALAHDPGRLEIAVRTRACKTGHSRTGSRYHVQQQPHGPHRMGRLRPRRHYFLSALFRDFRPLDHRAVRARARA